MYKQKIGILCAWLFLLSTFYCLLSTKEAAAASLSLGINPPIAQIVVKSPASVSTPFTVYNFTDTPITVDLMLKPFTASQKENGEVSYVQSISGPNQLIFQYVSVKDGATPINTLTLSPKQQKKLALSIEIPENEVPSDYYFSVLFVSKDLQGLKIEGGHSVTNGGIAMNVLLSIGPKGNPQTAIEEFSAPLFLEKGPVPFTVRVKNIGDQVIAPVGYILIQNMFGQTIGKVNLLKANILVGTVRALPDDAQNPAASNSATLHSQIQKNNDSPIALWNDTFILGPYTATLYLKASDNSPEMTSTARFVGAPIQTVVGLALAIALILMIKKRVQRKLTL